MAKIIATHKVKDFSTWKPLYDGDEERRSGAGIRTISVKQGTNDPNMVYMYWETDNPDKVTEMMQDPDLKAKMEEAGVEGPIDFCILEN
ncbi:MAG: hypothetical protein IH946_09225 [Bacteroidetes bacterium]|nr:hypothetical protein [Bacteroidota bacterium]